MKTAKQNHNNFPILVKLATYFSVATAAVIIIIKLIAWVKTGSLSMLSSLADSVFDILASLVNLFALQYALKPADDDHRFGHGKAEDMAALLQSAFIAGSALFITVEAIHRFIEPVKIDNENIGIVVMVISSVLALFLLTFQSYVIKMTGSLAIRADSLHYKTDLSVNLIVIISLAISKKYNVTYVDPVFAIFIAAYIAYSAFKIAKTSFDNLMDKEFDEATRQKILNIILKNDSIKGVHDLRTRRSGTKPIIQFHLEIDGNISLNKAHDISDNVEKMLLEEFPNAEILIHQDPATRNPIDLTKGHVVKP